MKIFIKTLENKYEFQVNPENTIVNLQYQIQDILQIDPLQQRLIFNGSPMNIEHTFKADGVQENSVIHLLICMI